MHGTLEDLQQADEGSDLDQAADRFLRSAWRSSPGILLSVAFHAALLAVLPLIIFQEKLRELAGIPITIGVSAQRLDPERPYKPISSGPPDANGDGGDEEPLHFPDSIDAQRNEVKSPDPKGDRLDGREREALQHLTDDALAGGFAGRLGSGPPGTNSIMGVGGGSGNGGAFRGFGHGGDGGRMNLAMRGGGSAATERAVALGLGWLARHQAADGSFRNPASCKCAAQEGAASPDVAATALAIVAFLSAGFGPESKVEVIDLATGKKLSYGKTVRAALAFLVKRQEQGHLIAAFHPSYEHAFATMALCEAARRSPKDQELRLAARKALDRALAHQTLGSGWSYGGRSSGSPDTSVTGTFVQALKSARLAGLDVPEDSTGGLRSFIESVTGTDGTAGYRGSSDVRGATTAIGLFARKFLDAGSTTGDRKMALAATKIPGLVGNGQTHRDVYTWYYSMLALFDFEGPRGPAFKAVNATVTTALVRAQHGCKDGCEAGSWDGDGAWLRSYGRPVVTAMSVLTLEVYYRFSDEAKERTQADVVPEKR